MFVSDMKYREVHILKQLDYRLHFCTTKEMLRVMHHIHVPGQRRVQEHSNYFCDVRVVYLEMVHYEMKVLASACILLSFNRCYDHAYHADDGECVELWNDSAYESIGVHPLEVLKCARVLNEHMRASFNAEPSIAPSVNHFYEESVCKCCGEKPFFRTVLLYPGLSHPRPKDSNNHTTQPPT